MKVKEKVFITDVDGCTLKWCSQILNFLEFKNFKITPEIYNFVKNDSYFNVRSLDQYFNGDFLEAYHSSPFGSQLSPVSEYIGDILKDISKKYKVISLTAFTDIPSTMENRKENLEKLFPNVFSDHVIIHPLASKEKSLAILNEKYDIQMFVDDRHKHIEEALLVLPPEKVHHLQSYDQWYEVINKLK